MIEVKDIKKSFNKKEVLKGVNVNFQPGKVYGLLGNNGAGKTTLMRIIFNMVKQDSGTILYNGLAQNKINYKRWFYFTETDVFPLDLTVGQYLKEIASLANIDAKEFKTRLETSLAAIKTDFKLTQHIKKLSSGQQKIMNCLALLIVKPDVIFLDEPTANMDIKNQKIVLDLISKLKNKNRIIVITTHLIKEIGDVLTDVVILDDGVVKYDKPLKASDNLSKIFDEYTAVETANDTVLGDYLDD